MCCAHVTTKWVGGRAVAVQPCPSTFRSIVQNSKYRPPNKMADYWKSNPRKFCEVCRCWFGDNKASVEFHERGRRHQENVKKMLSTARQRATKNEKEALQTKEILASIEMAAAAAYMRDLEGGQPTDARPSIPSSLGATTTPSPALPPALAENFQFRKAKAHVEILTAIQERQTKSEREVATKPPPPPPSQWQQAATPEGHLYYYNIFTRETQWEEPENFEPLPPDLLPHKKTEPKPPTIASAYSSSVEEAGWGSWLGGGGGEEEGERGRKRAGEEEVEGEEAPRPKRPTGPYGAWTTVALHPREPEPVPEVEEEEEGGESDSEEEREDHKLVDEEEERLKFSEKTAPSLAEGEPEKVTPGSFRGFGFKKRKSERPQIRQRTSELS